MISNNLNSRTICDTIKLNDSEMCEKVNNDGVNNFELSSALVSRLDINVELMFSIVSFVRTDAVLVTRLDTEVELTLSITSLTRLDDAPVTRLDTNIKSMSSSI